MDTVYTNYSASYLYTSNEKKVIETRKDQFQVEQLQTRKDMNRSSTARYKYGQLVLQVAQPDKNKYSYFSKQNSQLFIVQPATNKDSCVSK